MFGPRGVSGPEGVPGPGEGGEWSGEVPGPRGVPGPGSAWSGVCAWSRGVCLVPGGCLVPRGGWGPPRTATAADGTHPTGMHSCNC